MFSKSNQISIAHFSLICPSHHFHCLFAGKVFKSFLLLSFSSLSFSPLCCFFSTSMLSFSHLKEIPVISIIHLSHLLFEEPDIQILHNYVLYCHRHTVTCFFLLLATSLFRFCHYSPFNIPNPPRS